MNVSAAIVLPEIQTVINKVRSVSDVDRNVINELKCVEGTLRCMFEKEYRDIVFSYNLEEDAAGKQHIPVQVLNEIPDIYVPR